MKNLISFILVIIITTALGTCSACEPGEFRDASLHECIPCNSNRCRDTPSSCTDCHHVGSCDSSPCIHGNCTTTTTQEFYNCTCEPGWMGEDCGTQVKDAESGASPLGSDVRFLQVMMIMAVGYVVLKAIMM
eukprot:XP_011663218.1 PREDICTED: delta and Notch-like epidermal growth factor-related receptor [Strongylocentrotus purpuratus]